MRVSFANIHTFLALVSAGHMKAENLRFCVCTHNAPSEFERRRIVSIAIFLSNLVEPIAMLFSSFSGDSLEYAAQSYAILLSLDLIHTSSDVDLCLTARQQPAPAIMFFTRLTSWESACKIIVQRWKISPLYPLPPSLALSHSFSRHCGINLKQRYSLFIYKPW